MPLHFRKETMADTTFTLSTFEDLTLLELYRIMRLRQEVFIVEQDCPYVDADGKDPESWHLMGFSSVGDLVAYARLLPAGLSYPDSPSIGRVLTAGSVRRTGLGKKLMQLAIEHCQKLFASKRITVSAQCYLDAFYRELGFLPTGETYLEDGIPHQQMVLEF